MDGIQAYKGDAAPPSTSRPSITVSPPAVNPAAVKSTSNYLTALRRRFWVVLAVAVPMAITTSILALKQPAVYLVRAEIEINAPDVDPWSRRSSRPRAAAVRHRARPTTSPPAKFDFGNRNSKSEWSATRASRRR